MTQRSAISLKSLKLAMPGAHRIEHKRRGRVYWYARRGGPQIWSGATGEEIAAADQIQEAYRDEVMQRPAGGTIARLIMDYRKSAQFAGLARSTRALYHQFLDEAEQRLGGLGLKEYASGAGRKIIREWRDEAAPASPRTADQIKSVVGAFTSWGRQEDRLPADCKPTADMPRLYSAPPQLAWTRAETALAAFLLPAYLSDVVRFALETGLRRTDLCKITWAAIDESAGIIRWHTTKGRKHRRLARIRLTPSLKATLRRIKTRNDTEIGTILTNSFGKPWKPTGLHTSLSAALDKLGIDKRLHGLRRAAATHLAGEGLSSREIATQLGWSESEAEGLAAIYIDEEEISRIRTGVTQ